MRILIPIDGSSSSTAAVAFVAARSAQMPEPPEVELFNVQYAIPPGAARVVGAATVHEYHRAEADSVTEPALELLKKIGLHPRVTTVVGSPAAEVAKAASAGEFDLVVMGSHGHTGLKKLLFGSVTSAVLAASSKPLLVLREPTEPAAPSLHVGIALDGSQYGISAVQYVVAHRSFFGPQASLTLLHALPDLQAHDDLMFFDTTPAAEGSTATRRAEIEAVQQAAFDQVMAPARTLLEAANMRADEVRLTSNNAGDAIAACAASRRLDVLLIGSHGDGALLSAMLGSVATRVAARCGNALLFIQKA